MTRTNQPFHPDLRQARFLPALSFGPRSIGTARWLLKRMGRRLPSGDGVRVEELDGLRIFRPEASVEKLPVLLWLHGGGYLFGSPVQDDASNLELVKQLGIVVVAARYRFAPEHAAPAATEDAYAALTYLHANAERLGIDAARIAIGGASAGGGLAASLALYAHDRGGPQIQFQMLIYPMLDDRTTERTDLDALNVRMWTVESNRYAWAAYLGGKPAGDYAAPARRENLAGLPPAWIGVGTLDLFHDEDAAYAQRLNAAGVPTTFVAVDGAFHGFDAMFAGRPVVRAFKNAYMNALRQGLGLGGATSEITGW